MNWKHIIKLWKITNPNRRKSLFLILTLVLLSSIAEVFTLGAVIPFVSILINPEVFFINENISKFLNFFEISNIENARKIITLGFILIILIASTIRLFLIFLINRAGYLIGADMTQLIYSTSLSQDYEFHLNANSSKMINILVGKINASIQSTIIPFIQLIASFILAFFIVAMIIFIDPISSLYIIVSIFFCYLLISALTNKLLVSNGKIISKKHETIMRILKDSSSGIREVILNQVRPIFIKNFSNSDSLLRKSQAMNSFIASSPRLLIELLAIIILSLAAFIYTSKSVSNIGTLPYIAMVIFAAQRLLPIMQQIYLSWASIQGAKANVEDTLDFYDKLHKNDNLLKKVSINFKHSIVFKNVSFKFFNGKQAINSINFKINKGEKIGIIGKTGSGKSTILNLLLGLIEPSDGEILIDNKILNKKSASNWQSKISSVSQNMFFLDDSIKNNITFNLEKKKISKNKLDHSIKASELKNFIDTLEKGQDTVIGEDGSRLSGGQKQRIAIARAIYKDSEVLILDEITSALDQITEDKIMNSIYKLVDKTVIIVSHKPQSLKKCNKIIKIDNGRISKIGTFNEIFNSK